MATRLRLSSCLMNVTCPYCQQALQLQAGGWAHRYTQVLLHLDRCVPDRSDQERQTAATQLVPLNARR